MTRLLDFHAAAGPDALIARIASRQLGLVTRKQLLDAGLTAGAINHRLERGRLFRIHRGVYAVGHPVLLPFAEELAAVLASGDGAVLSHRSAAVLWELLPPTGAEVDVTVTKSAGNRPGIRARRCRLGRRDVRRRNEIPVTSPARTLLDIAETVSPRELERATAEARARGVARDAELRDQIGRNPGRNGRAPLRAMLDREQGPALTRSEAERRLLELVRAAALPSPEANAKLAGFEVDFLWSDSRLVVEVDGYAFHSSRTAFERDRRRDSELQAQGFRVVRVTWRQI